MDDFQDEMDFDVDYLYKQMGEEEPEDDSDEDEPVRRPDPPSPSHMRRMMTSVTPRVAQEEQQEEVNPFQSSAGSVGQQLSDLKEAVHQLFLSVCALYEVVSSESASEPGEENRGEEEKHGEEEDRKGERKRGLPWWALVNLASNALLLLLLLLVLVLK